VYAIVVTPENKIVIGGSFTEVNGQPRIGVARLNGDEYEIRIVSFGFTQGIWQQRNTTLPGRTYVFEASADLNNWTALRTNVAGGYSLEFMDSTSPGQMHRFYRVRQVWP